MNVHVKTAATPADLKQRLETSIGDLHHRTRILTILMEGVEQELFDLKQFAGIDVLSMSGLSHALHQAYEVAGTANDLRDILDELTLVTPSVRQAE